jgi:hypothetical protein
MKISYTFFQHLGPQILSLVNTKNQPNGEKKSFFLLPFQNGFCSFQNSYIVYYLSNALYEHCQTYMYTLFIHERKLKSIALFNIFIIIILRWKL